MSFALSSGLVIALGFALVGLGYALAIGLVFALTAGLISGPAAGFYFGGLAFVQHFALRLVCALCGYAPWNYPRFLDYAVDRILLRRVGGGYIFIHRMLLEYVAALSPEEIDALAAASAVEHLSGEEEES